MQEKNSLQTLNLNAIENAITKQRLKRFMEPANYDLQMAVEIYQWNCRLSESFYMPIHVCEVVCRNSIQKALRARLSNPWYNHPAFLTILMKDKKQYEHLQATLAEEKQQHGNRLNDDHIVSSLHFGFWEHLTTKRFERLLWLRGIKHNFPNAYSNNLTIRDITPEIQSIRQWRNRIAHHRAIFDKDPEKKFEQIIKLIDYSCSDTAQWVRTNSNVKKILSQSPKAIQLKRQKR